MSSSTGNSAEKSLTADRLRELLNYDPGTGVFTWRVSRRGVKVGSVAGTLGDDGYVRIAIDGRLYRSHRLAWLYVNSRWPSNQIDHINGIRSDNRIANLREATQAENQQNRARNDNNKSGFAGVSWDKAYGKWRATIHVNGRQRHLGRFSDPAEAHAAYLSAKAQLHTFSPTVRGAE